MLEEDVESAVTARSTHDQPNQAKRQRDVCRCDHGDQTSRLRQIFAGGFSRVSETVDEQ